MNEIRQFLRHATAVLAYRGSKTLRGAPPEFANFKASPTTRTPIEILAHIGDLVEISARRLSGPTKWQEVPPDTWEKQTARFHAALKAIDDRLASPEPIDLDFNKWYQGPFIDAMQHVGQLAMLRRMFGAPIQGEAFYFADIRAGQVGPDQPEPESKYTFE